MLSNEEKTLMQKIILQNKISKRKPNSISGIAKEVGISRQCLYLALRNKAPHSENRIKTWLEDQRDCICDKRIYAKPDKLSILKHYGFKENDKVLLSRKTELNNLELQWKINENNQLVLNIRDNQNINEDFEDFLYIYDLIKQKIFETKN